MKSKLERIREELIKEKLDGIIINHEDCHGSEYLAKSDERLEFVSNFSGSNGVCLISLEEAILWTDSRYYLQASKELDQGWRMLKIQLGEQAYYDYISQNYSQKKIGYNARTMTIQVFQMIEKKINLEDSDLVERVWRDHYNRPESVHNSIEILDYQYAGKTSQDKLDQLRTKMEKDKIDFYIVSRLDEIAWLFNLRGTDIPYNPLFKSYFIISSTSLILFLGKNLLQSLTLIQYLQSLNCQYFDYNTFYTYLSNLQQQTVFLSTNQTNAAIYQILIKNQCNVNLGLSYIDYMKCIKNDQEIEGFKVCHRRDGKVLAIAFSYLEQILKDKQEINEYDFAQYLNELRCKQQKSKGISFETISASGSNAAIVHYKPEAKESKQIKIEDIFLCDSGGQYLDGTTDVTRTFQFGDNVDIEMRDRYTRVLLGNLDIERLKWPKNSGINGANMDVLARQRLWNVGLDYGHGTGHGVGSYGCVHEGPQAINLRNSVAFQHGMIVTNEPGFYKQGHYGIRIENQLLILQQHQSEMLSFHNLTLCPYDINLIDISQMSQKDKDYINQYHKRVYDEVSPLLNQDIEEEKRALDWLKTRSQKI